MDFPEEPMGDEPMAEPTNDISMDDMGGEPAPADDKPFDDTPFDAGVEADEASDPKTYIQQLAGKIGQSLRSYTEENGIDFDLEKFAINSLISATNTGQMEAEDQDDIIEKVKGSAKEDEEMPDIEDVDDMNTGASEPQEAPPGPSDMGGGAPGGMAESVEDEVDEIDEEFYTLPKEHKQVFKNAKLGVTENIKTTLREYTENREDDFDRMGREIEYGVDGHDYINLGEEEEDFDRMGREVENGIDGHDYIDLGEEENVSNDLFSDGKKDKFVGDNINSAIKRMIDGYLATQNGFSEEETPTIKPQTKPEPTIIPRRRKPYRVSPNPNPNPKANY